MGMCCPMENILDTIKFYHLLCDSWRTSTENRESACYSLPRESHSLQKVIDDQV